jgi:osmotically-inducible protein OsmY
VGTVKDAAITTSIQARYFADDLVRGRNIDVDTENGAVTLSGTVQNAQEKQRAVQVAREIEGVTEVHDRLQIGTAAASAEPRTETERAVDAGARDLAPAWITTKIQAQYFVNPDLKPWNIDVTTTSDGTVTLQGEVDDANDRQKALEIARTTEGVTGVQDRLRVRGEKEAEAVPTTGAADEGEPRPDAEAVKEDAREAAGRADETLEPLGDAWLTSKIQSKYFLDDEVKGRDIDVTTAGGTVTLTGVVASDAERRQAVAIARSTDGVKDVQDRLRVDASAARETVDPRSFGIGGVENPFGDEWLKTKIESKFFMDRTVKTQHISVEVQDGVVTLTGEAQSDAARKTAEEIARGTAGVKQVENRISVAGGSR